MSDSASDSAPDAVERFAPLDVVVTRGETIESRHAVSAAVVRGDRLIAAWGDVEAGVFARSSLKPLQALALLAHDASLAAPRLALACASHNGEAVHVEAVMAWLADLGLDAGALECGAHEPIDPPTARAMIVEQVTAGAQHNNCSGKHCGFLQLAGRLGVPARDYTARDHPVQQEVRRQIGRLLDLDMDARPWGVDGCSAPIYSLPLSALARGFARLADPGALPADLAASARRVFAAMAGAPYLVAGRGRFDTQAMETLPGRLIVKGGAEGVWAAAHADSGIGIALKVRDGAKRAAEIAMAGLLGRLLAQGQAFDAMATAPVLNARGRQVGEIRIERE